MTQDKIELSAVGSPYFAAVISIVFVLFSIQSILVGVTVAGLLVLYYAFTVPRGITLLKNQVIIRYYLRSRAISISEIKLQWRQKKGVILECLYPAFRRTRRLNVEVSDPSHLESWCLEHGYELNA